MLGGHATQSETVKDAFLPLYVPFAHLDGLCMASFAQYEPLGQILQPLRSLTPLRSPYRPDGHGEHAPELAVDPPFPNLPTSHLVHATSSSVPPVLGGLDAYFPDGQAVQSRAVRRPSDVENLPTGHGVTAVEPATRNR